MVFSMECTHHVLSTHHCHTKAGTALSAIPGLTHRSPFPPVQNQLHGYSTLVSPMGQLTIYIYIYICYILKQKSEKPKSAQTPNDDDDNDDDDDDDDDVDDAAI